MASGPWGGALNQRVFRAKILFTRGGQQCQTGFHLRDVGINTLDAEDVATEVADWATNEFVKILHTGDRVTGIDVTNLVSNEGFSVSPANAVGLLNETPGPSLNMLTVSLKGSLRKRYGNGRMFWPISVMGGNAIAGNAITVYNALATQLAERFIGPSITTSMHLVHLHKDIPATEGHPLIPATWYDITSLRVNNTVSALKSRKIGSGS
jgi:hypothetical protein